MLPYLWGTMLLNLEKHHWILPNSICHTLNTFQNISWYSDFSLGSTSRIWSAKGQATLGDTLTLELPDGLRGCLKRNISVVLGVRNIGSCQEKILVLIGRKKGENNSQSQKGHFASLFVSTEYPRKALFSSPPPSTLPHSRRKEPALTLPHMHRQAFSGQRESCLTFWNSSVGSQRRKWKPLG